MQPTILITGANGYIGNAISLYLASIGYSIRGMSTQTLDTSKDQTIEWIQADITKLSTLAPSCKGIDIIIHCAARKNDEIDSKLVNVQGTKNIIEQAKKNGCTHFIYISTQSVKLPKLGVYGTTKLEGELIVQKSGIPYTILRPSIIYSDEKTGIIGSIIAMSSLPIIPIFGNGKTSFRPIKLTDFCKCIEACIQKSFTTGRTYDIGGPTIVQFNDIVRGVLRTFAKPKPFIYIPAWLSIVLARFIQILPKPPVTISNVLGAVQPITMDIQPMLQDILNQPESYTIGAQSDSEIQTEGTCLLQYLDPTLNNQNLNELSIHYRKAIKKHLPYNLHILSTSCTKYRLLLSACDAISTLMYTKCILQKKLLIASAIYECSPASSAKLLPKKTPLLLLLLDCTLLGLQGGAYAVIGILLHFYPNYIKHTCGI